MLPERIYFCSATLLAPFGLLHSPLPLEEGEIYLVEELWEGEKQAQAQFSSFRAPLMCGVVCSQDVQVLFCLATAREAPVVQLCLSWMLSLCKGMHSGNGLNCIL